MCPSHKDPPHPHKKTKTQNPMHPTICKGPLLNNAGPCVGPRTNNIDVALAVQAREVENGFKRRHNERFFTKTQGLRTVSRAASVRWDLHEAACGSSSISEASY